MKINAKNVSQHLPKIPKALQDRIRKECFEHYIIYRRNRNGSFDCHCTHCQKFFHMPSLQQQDITNKEYYFAVECSHGAKGICPKCGEELTFKSHGRIGNLKHRTTLMLPLSMTKTTGWIIQTYVTLRHNIVNIENQTPSQICFSFYNIYRIENTSIKRFIESYYSREYYQERIDIYQPEWYKFFDVESLFKNDRLKYIKDIISCRTHEGLKIGCAYPMQTIWYYLENPGLEKVYKAGFHEICREITALKTPHKRTLDLSADKLSDIFRMPPQVYSDFCENVNTRNVSLSTVQGIQAIIKAKHKINAEQIKQIYRFSGNKKELVKVIKWTELSANQIINYLEKQLDKYNENCCSHGQTSEYQMFSNYTDYLDECRQLEYDLTDSIINRPKDLLEKHAETSQLVAMLKDKLEAERLQKIAEKNKKSNERRKKELEWQWKDLICILPELAAEIIAEGKVLKHCVGGYAKRHVSCKTTILFVREKDKPDVPCWTMEVRRNGKKDWYIVQLHGFKNQDRYRREHFLNFRKAYEQHLQKVNAEKTKKKVRITA